MRKTKFRSGSFSALVCGVLACSVAYGRGGDPVGSFNRAPPWLGSVTSLELDGVSDDLLTAGLGVNGLAGAAPTVLDATDPRQLRRLAIWTNYRAVLDITVNGGYSRFYGPNIDANGQPTLGAGMVAGTEYFAYARAEPGHVNVTLMVQVPANFDPASPCIVTGTSSGSRGIYGAIGSSGEWGLKRGCAVAYSDKGGGSGVHDLQGNTVNLINGVRADAAAAGSASNFTARLSETLRQEFNANTPNRFAVKHAHSQVNPEKDWGRDTLRAVEFAFYVLNEKFGRPRGPGQKKQTIVPGNTIVIASSISNGAGAALAAAEEDRHGLIDGVAVTEPNIQIDPRDKPLIRRGASAYTAGARPLYDYFTYANLYQPCAAIAPAAAAGPLAFASPQLALATNRCTSLAEQGLLTSTTTAAQAEEALTKLLDYGWELDSIPLLVSHWRFATPGIVATYGNAYGRFSVADNLCGLSFAATDAVTGVPVEAGAGALGLIFGTGNGIPPTAGINIVNNLSVGGARLDTISVSPASNRADFNLDGARCQRNLYTDLGRRPGVDSRRLRAGVAQVQRTADLRRKPAIIVHGRADTLIPVNFSSRPYYAENQRREGRRSRLSYIEVTHAQHFDAFLSFPGYDSGYVPLHLYLHRALDLMWDHLKKGDKLPPSQVVRASPRGGPSGAAPALMEGNVPAILLDPPTGNRIAYRDGVLTVPD